LDTATRQVHETYRYSAFGEEQLFDENNTFQDSVSNPWRFSSKRTNPETGFIFFGRRYYSSLIGRFLTPDPVGFSDGPNLYALDHWNRHGKEFSGVQNSKQYVESAWKFRDRTDVMMNVRSNGERVLYDPRNNTFGVFKERGVPKTMFKPRGSMKYFNNEKWIPYAN